MSAGNSETVTRHIVYHGTQCGEILEVELDESEKEKFAKSCDIIRGFLERAESVK